MVMPQDKNLSFFYFFFLLLFCHESQAVEAAGAPGSRETMKTQLLGGIGAIMDYSSPASRVQRVVMEMALEDYHNSTGNRITLLVRDSQGDAVQAALAAMDLINEKRVQAISGLQTWPETASVAKLGNVSQVPVLSLAEACPRWSSERWPFLLRVTRNHYTLTRALFTIINSWQWRSVTIIYEDTDYIATNIIQQLIDASEEMGSGINYQLALNTFSSIPVELEKLRNRPGRIFIVHTSLALATRLFAEAMHLGMMSNGYAWITTNMVTDFIESFNSSVIASMQGVIGIRSYFPRGGVPFKNFCSKFKQRFRQEYPEEVTPEPDNFVLQAYDAMSAVAQAVGRSNAEGNYSYYDVRNRKKTVNTVPHIILKRGHQLLQYISLFKFSGLSGDFQFVHGELTPLRIFEIINVVGRSFRDMGFWTHELGFSRTVDPDDSYSMSMKTLGQVLWPGDAWSVPGWRAPPTTANPLRIGVPAMSAFTDYVKVKYDETQSPIISGFSIDIFKAVVDHLPYNLPYQFVPYHGTYDSLAQKVSNKTFDAVVGDTCILSYRCEYVEFSQSYTESGIMMVVSVKPTDARQAWIFIKPFTTSLWALIGVMSVYNALIVWLMERNHNRDFRGSSSVGNLFWLSFTTLFPNGERMHNNLSQVVMVVWLFAGLVFTSSYTASLSSMLTVRKLEPSVIDVDLLKRTHAGVGCNKGSSVVKFLRDVLEIHPKNIIEFSSGDDYPKAFRNGTIKAAFLKVPHGKLFLAKYCNDFMASGPIYHYGGFGFIFPKGSLLILDISEAILKVLESGKMHELENAVLSSYNCSSSSISESGNDSLNLRSFSGLFAVMGLTPTVAILLYGCHNQKYFPARSVYSNTSGALLSFIKHLKDSKDMLYKKITALLNQKQECASIPSGGHGPDTEDGESGA